MSIVVLSDKSDKSDKSDGSDGSDGSEGDTSAIINRSLARTADYSASYLTRSPVQVELIHSTKVSLSL